ncbi:MAG: Sua5/YciO/YrdC/YwlC family protein, partial [Oceanococcaceae bacterium]
ADEWRFRVLRAATAVRRGGVVLYPTEGVWGLGCDPRQPVAARRLMMLKRRDEGKGLILLAAHAQATRPWEQRDMRRWARATAPLAGRSVRRAALSSGEPRFALMPPLSTAADDRATTWLRPTGACTAPELRGRHRTIAIRVTRYGPTRALCRAAGGVLTSTSANVSGAITVPLRRWAVLRRFGPRVDAIVGLPLGGQSRPSRIFDTVSQQWIRH